MCDVKTQTLAGCLHKGHLVADTCRMRFRRMRTAGHALLAGALCALIPVGAASGAAAVGVVCLVAPVTAAWWVYTPTMALGAIIGAVAVGRSAAYSVRRFSLLTTSYSAPS